LLTPERRARLEQFRPTMRYLSGTEVHVYALAVAASVLLSFFPFLNVMLSICRNVLHSRAAEDAIYLALTDFFPGETADFLRRNLAHKGNLELTSMFLLLFTANGVFEPLEVALNRAWGEHKNRSYLMNQAVALGMIFLCGGLALVSLMLSAANREWLSGYHFLGPMLGWLNLLMFKLGAIPISIFALFLVYWLLPNRKIEPMQVAPTAIVVGLILEALKYLNLAITPYLTRKLEHEYYIFSHSAAILLWSFVGAMVVLAGAEWTARMGSADRVSCGDDGLGSTGEGAATGSSSSGSGADAGAADRAGAGVPPPGGATHAG
jgi:membrane protein